MPHHNEHEIEELHQRFLKRLYDLSQDSYLGLVYVHRLGQKLGMNSVGYLGDREELGKIAGELEEAGYVRGTGGKQMSYSETGSTREQTEGLVPVYSYYALTEEGERRIKENEDR